MCTQRVSARKRVSARNVWRAMCKCTQCVSARKMCMQRVSAAYNWSKVHVCCGCGLHSIVQTPVCLFPTMYIQIRVRSWKPSFVYEPSWGSFLCFRFLWCYLFDDCLTVVCMPLHCSPQPMTWSACCLSENNPSSDVNVGIVKGGSSLPCQPLLTNGLTGNALPHRKCSAVPAFAHSHSLHAMAASSKELFSCALWVIIHDMRAQHLGI
jgi:hypothetical protein